LTAIPTVLRATETEIDNWRFSIYHVITSLLNIGNERSNYYPNRQNR
jgi:hypothetical protein